MRTSQLPRVTADSALRLMPGVILVAAGLVLFGSTGHDDSHITYWPAHTLAHFGEMVNYSGDRVEQSSSLLQVLLLAILEKSTGLGVVTLGKVTSILFGAATLVVVFQLVTRVADRGTAFCATLISAVSPYFVYWSYGGLESTLASLLGATLILTIADYLTDPPRASLWRPAATMVLFELVRPETPIVLTCVLIGMIAVALLKARTGDRSEARRVLSRLGILLAISLITFGLLAAFRWTYFGSAFPQPVTVKTRGISFASLKSGMAYIDRCILGNVNTSLAMTVLALGISGGVAVLVIVQMRAKQLNWYVVVSLLYVAGYLSFVVVSGGDWMSGGRFLVPVLPVAIAIVPLGIAEITNRRFWLVLATLVLVAFQSEAMVAFAMNGSTGIPLGSAGTMGATTGAIEYSWFERHSQLNIRDLAVLESLDRLVTQLVERHHRPVVLMSGQMGVIPYHLAKRHYGDVRFIDMWGLADRTFSSCPIMQRVPKTQFGLWIEYDYYFAHLSELEGVCGWVKPDILYDLGNAVVQPRNVEGGSSLTDRPLAYDVHRLPPRQINKQQMADNGYTVVYAQVGPVVIRGSGVPVRGVRADEFIAVRSDLLESIDTSATRSR